MPSKTEHLRDTCTRPHRHVPGTHTTSTSCSTDPQTRPWYPHPPTHLLHPHHHTSWTPTDTSPAPLAPRTSCTPASSASIQGSAGPRPGRCRSSTSPSSPGLAPTSRPPTAKSWAAYRWCSPSVCGGQLGASSRAAPDSSRAALRDALEAPGKGSADSHALGSPRHVGLSLTLAGGTKAADCHGRPWKARSGLSRRRAMEHIAKRPGWGRIFVYQQD